MILVDILLGTTQNTYPTLGFGHRAQAHPLPVYITSHITFLPNMHINVSKNSISTCTTQVHIEKLAIFSIFHFQSGKVIGNIHPTPTVLHVPLTEPFTLIPESLRLKYF